MWSPLLHSEVVGIVLVQMGKPRPALGVLQASVTPLRADVKVRLAIRMHHPTCLALLLL